MTDAAAEDHGSRASPTARWTAPALAGLGGAAGALAGDAVAAGVGAGLGAVVGYGVGALLDA